MATSLSHSNNNDFGAVRSGRYGNDQSLSIQWFYNVHVVKLTLWQIVLVHAEFWAMGNLLLQCKCPGAVGSYAWSSDFSLYIWGILRQWNLSSEIFDFYTVDSCGMFQFQPCGNEIQSEKWVVECTCHVLLEQQPRREICFTLIS